MSAPASERPSDPDAHLYPRTVLFVAGAGRSGTSTLAGIVQRLGMHVPLPEVPADDSNPRGFSEPQWAVDQHDRLLREAVVQVSDARPEAWFETGRISTREPERIRFAAWLEEHLTVNPELVVKDPRLSWFLGLWRVAAVRSGARPVFATMLRPPAEVVGSKQTYYANRLGSAHLAASWLNMLLHTERATREALGGTVEGSGRVFVRYGDLLDDWVRTTTDVAERLSLQHVLHSDSEAIRDVHRFVDPGLRRMTQTLDDLELPPRLHELVDATWTALNTLAEPDGDQPEVHRTLDEMREAYVDLYEESAAITRSSVVAARKEQQAQGGPGTPGAGPAPSRGVDRIPHGVRAAVPPSVRRGVRKALGRERP